MSDETGGTPGAPGGLWTPEALMELRTDQRRRTVALVVAVVVGLAVAWVHWVGLFVAGALVGLVSRTLPRALLAGVGFGVVVLAVTVLTHSTMSVGEFLTLTPPVYVAIGVALVAPAWGSLIRGVI